MSRASLKDEIDGMAKMFFAMKHDAEKSDGIIIDPQAYPAIVAAVSRFLLAASEAVK